MTIKFSNYIFSDYIRHTNKTIRLLIIDNIPKISNFKDCLKLPIV